jgi:hypothetical protein
LIDVIQSDSHILVGHEDLTFHAEITSPYCETSDNLIIFLCQDVIDGVDWDLAFAAAFADAFDV